MYKILTGGQAKFMLNVTVGKPYYHTGYLFSDDNGSTRNIGPFAWKSVDFDKLRKFKLIKEVIPSSCGAALTIGKEYSHIGEYFKDDEERFLRVKDFEWEVVGDSCENVEEESAMRFNEGKAELSYIMSMPNAMAGVSAAFAMGAKKYARDNWKKGLDRNQLVDSALRHLSKSQNGEVFDEESGLDHLFHFAWNALVLAEQEGLQNNEPN